MMSEEQFIESQKECASMIGMSLSEYQKYCKNLKVPKQKKQSKKYNNSILKFLGLTENDLKTKKGE